MFIEFPCFLVIEVFKVGESAVLLFWKLCVFTFFMIVIQNHVIRLELGRGEGVAGSSPKKGVEKKS